VARNGYEVGESSTAATKAMWFVRDESTGRVRAVIHDLVRTVQHALFEPYANCRPEANVGAGSIV
jgi:hypothetical protein